ncbi:serine hydrolase [Quadrisphaera sp. KR29]|uniref:serine hydrolase n=1 Tax=Quadrisphaera sp. KR29 TaxID=3461391 RepID=UPI004043D854
MTVRPPGAAPAHPAPRPVPDGRGRDTGVDLLRSVALLRVVVWHALAAAWVTWALPAVPVLFFATGALLAQGRGRRPWRRVLPARLRRLLLPVWAYGVVVAGTVLAAPLVGAGTLPALTPAALARALPWVVPLVAPQGAAWQGGWLSGHLWYITAHLWFLLLAPLLLALARWPLRTLAAAAAGVGLLEASSLLPAPGLSPAVRLGTGDLLCYGLFVVLGAAWARRPRVGAGTPVRPLPVLVGAALLGLAAAFALASPTAGPVVNDSYVLLLLTGVAWLALLAGVEGPLRAVADRPAVARATAAVSARAMTVYLWHPAAVVVTVWLLRPGAGAAGAVVVLAGTAVLTALAVLLLGWLEDLAARRPVRLLPLPGPSAGARPAGPRPVGVPLRLGGPAALTAGATSVVLALALTAPASVVTALPPPSDRTALGDAAFSQREPVDLAGRDAPLTALDERALQAALDGWAEQNPQFGQVTAAVASGDVVWAGSASTDGPAPDPAQPVPLLSLTKTVTAALVLRQVSAGALALDEPVPPVEGVVPPAGEPVTLRQLLQHTSGIPQYFTVEGYDPQAEATAAELVSLSTSAQRWAEPGTEVVYTNSGYLWLTLLLEQVTGEPYAEQVAGLVEPLGLEGLRADVPDGPGWVGQGSGGVSATPGDAARWVDALLGRQVVLTAEELAVATDLGTLNTGLSVWPLCPCWTDPDGTRRAAGLGHHLSSGGAYAFPAERVTMLGWMEPSGPEAQAALPGLLDALRTALPG